MINQIFWELFNLAANAFETFIILYFTAEFLDKKRTGKTFFISFAVTWTVFFTVVTVSNYFTEFEGIATFLYCALIFLFALLFLQGKIPQKIIISLIPIIAIVLINSFVALIISSFCDYTFAQLLERRDIYHLMTIIITKFLLYYVLLIVYRIFDKEKGIHFGKKEWIPIAATFLISSCIFICIDLINIRVELPTEAVVLSLTAVFFLILINIVCMYMVVKISRGNKIETENKLLKLQTQYQTQYADNIKAQEKEIHTIRHDLKNNLFVLNTLLNNQKYEEAKKYIDHYLEQETLLGGNILTDNETVNAIVNTKIAYAKSSGIRVMLEYCRKIPPIDDIDLCNMLGNLLDNAIEACCRCGPKERKIGIQIAADESIFTISVKNTIPYSVLEKNTKLATSKKEKNLHGFGISSVRETVEKYEGTLDIFEKEHMFCVLIRLPSPKNL